MNLWTLLLAFCLIIVKANTQDMDDTDIGDGDEYTNPEESNEKHNINVTQNRLAAQLLAVLEHYKQADPLGLPGFPIPDPMDVPDIKQTISMSTIQMMEVKAYGLSKFRIAKVKADLNDMKVEVGIELDVMIARGKYTLSNLFSSAKGPFSVLLKRVYVRGIASLEVDVEGHLVPENIEMDITFGSMNTDFQNLGFLGGLFQSIINSAPNLVFDVMKPFILKDARQKIHEEITKNVDQLMGDRLLPNSITPLDMAIAEGRKLVRAKGYDPYHLKNYNHTMGLFSVVLANTYISGISNFYRVGNMSVEMRNNTVHITLQLGTQKITGAGQWEIGVQFMSRVGHMQFTVQHIRLTVSVSQSLDTRNHPKIEELQIDMGNIQVRCDGAGTLDYILEFVVNVLPNLLRYQIMDALEGPLKQRIQEKFNTIDVEEAIKKNIDKFEHLGKDISFDFKLD